jgi:DNA invertase Pin-like site-specific DNA recombinase
MKIGYARVSTKEQSLNLQKDALEKVGCEKIFSEHISGAKSDRPQLQEMIKHLREGDVVVVWKLDRLERSLRDLVNLVSKFQEAGVEFQSLQDNIDTTTPTGKLAFHMFAAWPNLNETLLALEQKQD